MNYSSQKVWDTKILTIVIASIILRVHPTFVPELVSVYAFDGLIIVLIFFTSIKRGLSIQPLELAFILVSAVLFLVRAIFVGFDSDSIMAEFKIIYYVICFCWLRSIIKENNNFQHIIKIFDICFFINVGIAGIQLLEIPGFTIIVHALYGEVGLRSLWSGYARIYGTFNNPNWFGVYLAIMSVIYTLLFLETGQKKRFIIRASLLAILLLASGSRSGLLVTIIGILTCLIVNRKIKPILYAGIAIGIIAILSTFLATKIPQFEKTFARFTRYFDLLFSSRGTGQFTVIAAESRWGEWQEAWNYYADSILFGKPMGEIIPHNSYIAYLIRFGGIASISAILLILSIIRQFIIRTCDDTIKKICLSSLVAFIAAMFTGDFLFTTQITMLEVFIISHLFNNNSESGGIYGQNDCILFTTVSSDSRKQ